MRANAAGLCLSLILGAGVCLAQEAPVSTQPAPRANQPDHNQVYCSGFVTDQKVADDIRLISGEQSNIKIAFARGDYVYINRGMNQGVREGDRFMAVRPVKDPLQVPWFKWQNKLMKAMGTPYEDLGVIRVVKVQPSVSIAEVTFSCAYMQRGDILRPYAERQVSQFKEPGPFDHFAPISGKPVAMVVAAKDFAQLVGTGATIYVNLGSNQGVKTGDYFRIFRYQGTRAETAPIEKDFQYKLFGYGSAPQRYQWNDLPREILGEGIVLNVSHNSATVLITYSTSDIYAGDYVEVE
jgi:hypothetical protein